MESSDQNKKDNPTDIYYFRPDLPSVDSQEKFTITAEGDKLRVSNKNVNILFSNLTPGSFDELYNDFNRHLNLDFDPVTISNKDFSVSKIEAEKLTESIITSLIYFYTINNLQVEVRRSDFTHPSLVDQVLSILDKKYGVDTEASLVLGAKILRQSLSDYTKTVKGRRRYYNR